MHLQIISYHYKTFLVAVKASKVGDLSLGQPEAPLTIATIPRCRGGCYSFCNIMAEGFRFMPLGLVSSFGSVHGLARCKHEHRCPHACARSGDITIVQMELGSANVVMHQKHAQRIWGDLKKVS